MSSERRGDPDTRASLLQAGRELLLSGSASFSVGAVATRAGVSRQAAYLHFDSRAALVVAVAEHANRATELERHVARVDRAETASNALDAFVSAAVWQATELGSAVRAVRELQRTDPEIAEAFRRRPGGRLTLARRVTTRLAAEHNLHGHLEPRTGAELLVALTSLETCEELLAAGWSPRRITRELRRTARAALCA